MNKDIEKKGNLLGVKSYADLIIRMAIMLCTAILLGVIFLIGVYALPTGEMKRNVARSSALFDYEGVYPQIVTGYKSSQLDNYSDTYMLASAIHPGSGNIIKDAMNVMRIEYNDLSMPLSLTSYANNVAAEHYEIAYPRYWHGYLTILKPILGFFDVGDIKIMNMICQSIMIFIVISILLEKKMKKYAIAFLMAVLLINPVTTSLSLHYSSVFYITMITLIIIWKQPKILQGGNKAFFYCLLFFGVGIVTSYFDLFTYPLVTLGLPLISFLILEEDNKGDWKRQVKLIILLCVCWAMGYAGMWIGKFIVGSILTGNNVLSDAFNRTFMYTVSPKGETGTLKECIYRSFKPLIKWPYVLGFGGTFVYFIVCIWKEKRKWVWNWTPVIPYLLIMSIPMTDMLIGEHVYWHYWFTYRELSITLLAGYCMLFACLQGKQENSINEKDNQNG